MTEPKPGDWLDVYGKAAHVVEVAPGRLIVDVYTTGKTAPQRRTYYPPMHGPFPPLPPDRVPKEVK
jgi:hypothetical protein